MQPRAEQALYDLLLELFHADIDHLRRFLEFGQQGRAVVASLPLGAPPVEFVHRAVNQLERRGLVDAALFDGLEAEFPLLRTRIQAVRVRWPDAMSAAPGPRALPTWRRAVRLGLRPGAPGERHAERKELARWIRDHAKSPELLTVNAGQQYVELERAVEVVAGHVPNSKPRLVPSLIEAIRRSEDPFILLEGDPGVGKTIALHEVEQWFAREIQRAPECGLRFPLCVKLRDVASQGEELVERVWACVLQALHPNPEVAAAKFDTGLRHGGWLLLLDGFDEMPGLLSETAATAEVRAHALAIEELGQALSGTARACQVVVASREYHGPSMRSWGKFRLKPLSQRERDKFITGFGLDTRQAAALEVLLLGESIEIQQWADNPLMLAMLCAVIRDDAEPPRSMHALFEQYLEKRFQLDEGRIEGRPGRSVAQVRRAAEHLGFAMTVEPALGLRRTPVALRTALERHGLALDDLDGTLKLLVDLQLMGSEARGAETVVGFRHRRLQEYFAACVLLREPDRVSAELLLFAAQWRETCVVLLQKRDPPAAAAALLTCAAEVLRSCLARLELAPCVVALDLPRRDALTWTEEALRAPDAAPKRIRWPHEVHHLLALLQAGAAPRRDLPREIHACSLSLLTHTYRVGTRLDRKAVLSVIGVLPMIFAEGFVAAGLDSDSELLQDLAFMQLPQLGKPSTESQGKVGRLLVRMARSGKLKAEQRATSARIQRTQSEDLVSLLDMACAAATWDRYARLTLFAGYSAAALVIASRVAPAGVPWWVKLLLFCFLATVLVPSLRSRDVKGKGQFLARLCADAVLFMFVLLGVVVALGEPAGEGFTAVAALWLYAYVWPMFAVGAVWSRISVPRRRWIILPFVLLWQGVRPLWWLALFGAGWFSALFALAFADIEPGGEIPFVVEVLLALVGFGVVAVGMVVAGRFVWQYAVDRWRWATMSREPWVLTDVLLRAELAAFRTSGARNRLLREVVDGRRWSIEPNEATRTGLERLLVALEAHGAVVAKSDRESVRAQLTLRVGLPADYLAVCTSVHACWCVEHCVSLTASDNLTTTVDLLTRLLERVESALQDHGPAGLASTAHTSRPDPAKFAEHMTTRPTERIRGAEGSS